MNSESTFPLREYWIIGRVMDVQLFHRTLGSRDVLKLKFLLDNNFGPVMLDFLIILLNWSCKLFLTLIYTFYCFVLYLL